MHTVVAPRDIPTSNGENHLVENIDSAHPIFLSAAQKEAVERAIRNSIMEKRAVAASYERAAQSMAKGGNSRSANRSRRHAVRIERDINLLNSALAAINPDL